MSNGASFIKSEIVEGHKVHFTFLRINDKITLVAEKEDFSGNWRWF